MPTTPQRPAAEQPQDTGWILLTIVMLLAVIGLAAGYYLYYTNRPRSSPTITPPPQPTAPLPQTPSPEPTPPTTTVPAATDTTNPAGPSPFTYAGWKTYIYRGTSAALPGFSIKYPPGYAIGQEYTKDETFFTVYKNPNPLNEEPVLEIRYDSNGDIRFSLLDKQWPYYDQVVQSFSKTK